MHIHVIWYLFNGFNKLYPLQALASERMKFLNELEGSLMYDSINNRTPKLRLMCVVCSQRRLFAIS